MRAIRDFRVFLSHREKHELWFFCAAIVVTTLLIVGFVHDAHVEKEYQRPEIQWVQDWRADRSDAQIKAQQAIDEPRKQARLAEIRKRQDERRAAFKRLDDKMEKWGL